MNYKTLVAASVMSVVLTSAAFAQCVDCALYPDRDSLNNGAPTPASKLAVPAALTPQIPSTVRAMPVPKPAAVTCGERPMEAASTAITRSEVRTSGAPGAGLR